MGTGPEISARVVSQAPCEDLALVSLRPTPKTLVEAQLGTSSEVQAGDRVIALGYPAAFEERGSDRTLQASEGIVPRRPARPGWGTRRRHCRRSSSTRRRSTAGNSGGPLFNRRAR